MAENSAESASKAGSALIKASAATGLYGGGGKLFFGYVCPVCLIATPVLLLAGLYRRWRHGGQSEDKSGYHSL